MRSGTRGQCSETRESEMWSKRRTDGSVELTRSGQPEAYRWSKLEGNQ